MKLLIEGQPTFIFELTLAQVNMLLICAKNHPNHDCRQSASYGGLINTWRFGHRDWASPIKVVLYRGELDLVSRVIEGLPSRTTMTDRRMAIQLQDIFRDAYQIINDLTRRKAWEIEILRADSEYAD